MSCKAAEITPNINNSFGLGTANECTVQWWFKETSLEDEETQWWAIRSWQQPVERIVEADPLTATGEVAEEFSIDPCAIIQHLKQIGKVKKLNKLVLHELTAKKKSRRFEVSSSLIPCKKNETYWSDCDLQPKVDFIQLATHWLEWEAPKHFTKPNLHQSRSSSLVVCCPSDPLQLSESQWNHYIWEVCSANWWDVLKTETPAAGIGQQKGPSSPRQHPMTACCTTNVSKVEWVGLQGFASSIIFTWPLATNYYFFKYLDNFFAGKIFRQPAGGRKCFTRVRWSPKHGFLCSRNKQTYFSLAKMCWL